jgi:hypothetical protein
MVVGMQEAKPVFKLSLGFIVQPTSHSWLLAKQKFYFTALPSTLLETPSISLATVFCCIQRPGALWVPAGRGGDGRTVADRGLS